MSEARTAANNNKNNETIEEGHGSSGNILCWVCQKRPIAYQPDPCGCPIYCASCAMKFATGGRCRKCKQMFGGMRQVRKIVTTTPSNE